MLNGTYFIHARKQRQRTYILFVSQGCGRYFFILWQSVHRMYWNKLHTRLLHPAVITFLLHRLHSPHVPTYIVINASWDYTWAHDIVAVFNDDDKRVRSWKNGIKMFYASRAMHNHMYIHIHCCRRPLHPHTTLYTAGYWSIEHPWSALTMQLTT